MEEKQLITTENALIISKEGNVSLENIAPSEVANYQPITNQLNENDANSILNFGAEIQQKIASQSDSFLNSVRVNNSGEIGSHINELLAELNYIDVEELNQSGFKKFMSNIPFLKNLMANVEKVFQKYDKVTVNIDKISNKVKAGMINSAKDNAALQTMFDTNLSQIKEIEKYIIAGTLKWNEVTEQLVQMDANPANFQDYQIADKRDFAHRLDKRLADMKIVRFIMMQTLAQIRVVQNNNTSIAEKAQSILTTTMPVWKNQLTLAVALQRQKQNIEVQKRVSDTTNTILQKNAEMLKQNSIEVAKENENTIVSLETLKMTTQSLIETLSEVKQIHQKGSETRRELDSGLQQLEAELKKNVVG